MTTMTIATILDGRQQEFQIVPELDPSFEGGQSEEMN
jgi:hypothetical protein